MRRLLLFCSGIFLGLVATAILGEGPGFYADGKTWLWPDNTRFVALGFIFQGVVVALGAALCLGRAFVPLTSHHAQSGTTVSGPDSVTRGGGPVLPICGMLFLYPAIMLFLDAQGYAEDCERLANVSRQMRDEPEDPYRQSRDEQMVFYRRHERTARTFGVLWLIAGGTLLGSLLFMKPRVWKLGWRIDGIGIGIAIGGLLLSGIGLFVWRVNGTFLRGAWGFHNFVGFLGVLAGTIVTVFGCIRAAVRDQPRD